VAKDVIVVHGGQRPDLAPIAGDQPPINRLEITEANTAFIDAGGDSPCIEGVEEVPGNLIIWDDGSLQDLQVLSALRRVGRQLIIYGGRSNGSSEAGGMEHLAGLEGLQVRAVAATAWAGDMLCQLDGQRALKACGHDGACCRRPRRRLPPARPGGSHSDVRVPAGRRAGVQEVGDALVILHTRQLRDLSALVGLATVGADVNIVDNRALLTLEGLGALNRTGA
jgi:hypothetical protein